MYTILRIYAELRVNNTNYDTKRLRHLTKRPLAATFRPSYPCVSPDLLETTDLLSYHFDFLRMSGKWNGALPYL